MIKAIATDLDGTLFYPKRRLKLMKSKNKRFLQGFINQGNKVILVTGRNRDLCRKVSKKLGSDGVVIIGCSGGFVSIKDELTSENPIAKNDALKLYDLLCQDVEIKSILVLTDKYNLILDDHPLNKFSRWIGKLIMKLQGAYQEKFISGRDKMIKVLNDDSVKIYKIMPWYGIGKKGDELARLATLRYQESVGDLFEVAWSQDAIEFVKKGANKATVLKQVLADLNIAEDETIVIGDSGNDIPLFKNFKNSFVMSQAPEEVKKEAKYVVESVADLKDYCK